MNDIVKVTFLTVISGFPLLWHLLDVIISAMVF